jgi:cell division protein FtsA
MTEQLVVGIDVGTTKVAVLVAALAGEGGLSLLGGALVPARGMRQGVVVNIEETSAAIAAALDRAERLSGRKIVSAYASLAGRHLAAANTRGVVAITPGGREIQYQDMARAIQDARAAIELADNREVVHQLPRGYVVDEQEGVPNPIGMAGFQLEVETHLVTGSATTIQNLIKCIHRAQVDLDDLVSAPLASAGAVLTPAEREMGTMVVDIGAGTMDLAIFVDGFPWYSTVLPGGGITITYGIAAGLRLPPDLAEQLKLDYGHCDPQLVAEDDLIALDEETLVLPRSELAQIIQAQARDLIARLREPLQEARREGVRPLGIVLTGGTAELAGLTGLVERILGLPTRVGAPVGLRGGAESLTGPRFATAAGVLLWGAQQAEGGQLATGGRARAAHLGQLTTTVRRMLGALLPQ